jgi:hypothetical protein
MGSKEFRLPTVVFEKHVKSLYVYPLKNKQKIVLCIWISSNSVCLDPSSEI